MQPPQVPPPSPYTRFLAHFTQRMTLALLPAVSQTGTGSYIMHCMSGTASRRRTRRTSPSSSPSISWLSSGVHSHSRAKPMALEEEEELVPCPSLVLAVVLAAVAVAVAVVAFEALHAHNYLVLPRFLLQRVV